MREVGRCSPCAAVTSKHPLHGQSPCNCTSTGLENGPESSSVGHRCVGQSEGAGPAAAGQTFRVWNGGGGLAVSAAASVATQSAWAQRNMLWSLSSGTGVMHIHLRHETQKSRGVCCLPG